MLYIILHTPSHSNTVKPIHLFYKTKLLHGAQENPSPARLINSLFPYRNPLNLLKHAYRHFLLIIFLLNSHLYRIKLVTFEKYHNIMSVAACESVFLSFIMSYNPCYAVPAKAVCIYIYMECVVGRDRLGCIYSRALNTFIIPGSRIASNAAGLVARCEII